jgi:hypothetical protein
LNHRRQVKRPAGHKSKLSPLQLDLPLSVDSPESGFIMVDPWTKLQSTAAIAAKY